MTELPNRVVGEAYSDTSTWTLLERLVDVGNRMAGQEGEHEGADAIREEFEAIGLDDVVVDSFGIPGWWRGSSSLELPDRGQRYPHQFQSLALPGTPAGTVASELVDLDHGIPEDFEEADVEGRIVMVSSKTPERIDRWIHRGEKYRMAIEAGASGFVFRNHIEGCLPPTGSIGGSDGPGDIPAIGVSRELGERLARYCADGAIPATLSVDCRNEPTESVNVSGALGPDTDEEVLVTAHVDAHDIAEGARDNGAGSVLVAEAARILSRVEDDLDTRVRFVTFGAEEVGLFGSKEWRDSHDLDAIKAVVNLDGVGWGRTPGVYTHGFDPLGEAFEAVADDLAIDVEVSDEIRPHSDHWPFVERGVPGCQVRSDSDDRGRGWGHTHADTLDKLDNRNMRDMGIAIAAGVGKIASDDVGVERVSEAEIEARMEERELD